MQRTSKKILLFADRLPPLIGGVEMHARYFIEHFTNHAEFPLLGIITKNNEGDNCLSEKEQKRLSHQNLIDLFNPDFIFFNSGRWIEELAHIRQIFPDVKFLYRTGGNEILKAPLSRTQISNHALRQAYWASNISQTIDVLITNSAYTEKRLREIGITCRFSRHVGGVNAVALKSVEEASEGPITIFCAARFVPYKNHFLLLSVIEELLKRGYKLRVRLAGDGPLLAEAKEKVLQKNLTSVVEFLGPLDNENVCHEIARANIYLQLSKDEVTEVPGGSYIHAEGMGRSILEALTAGTFVIAGRSGALDEIVTEDKGLLVDLNSLERIADQVEQVVRELPGQKVFTDRYSWTNIFNQYEELFGELSETTTSYRKM